MPRLTTFFACMAIFLFTIPASAAPVAVPNFHGLRIPDGGKAQGAAPGGQGKIIVYTYGKTPTALAIALVALLKKDGWKTESHQKSPRGTQRLTVSRQGKTVKISVAGVGPKSALILNRK
jgi:hypothetical protein